MRQINHRDLELDINTLCNCDDHLQLKIAAYYPHNNKIAVAARRGEDHFFLVARGRKSDLSEAIPLDSRYLIIGDPNDIEKRIFDACILQNKADVWLTASQDDLFAARLLIAGAARVLSITDALTPRLAQTSEYRQALIEKRVIEIIVC